MTLLLRTIIFHATACLLLTGCLPSLPDGDPQPGITYRGATNHRFQLARRTFLLHVPNGYRSESPLPLLVVLHGAFSTAEQTEAESGFSALADEERFLVVYPEGIGLFGYLQHWNAGHCCGKAADDMIDDVGFIEQVIETVQRRLAVNPQRVYLVGMSNGGMLVNLLAAKHGERFAAAAVISGAISSTTPDHPLWKHPEPGNPVPMLLVHGDADQHIPINGGASPLPGRQSRSLSSFDDAVRYWVHANGCQDEQPAINNNPEAITRSIWSSCLDACNVETIVLHGWRHLWPTPYFTDQLAIDSPLVGYDGRRDIWQFLSSYRRR